METKNENPKEYFAETLRKLMDKHGFNQLALSAAIGIRQSQISNYLNGKSLPGFYQIKALAEHFGVNADVILGL